MNRAVFLDRDGVLNEAIVRDGTPHPPASVGDLRIVRGAAEAIERLHRAGYLAIAITNQPDVARGTTTREAVDAINARVADCLALEGVYTCYHDGPDACDCRKPKPGLVQRAAREHQIDVRGSCLVGDRAKDVECGRAAGCMTIFIDLGYGETPARVDADLVVASLDEAVDAIVAGAVKRSTHA